MVLRTSCCCILSLRSPVVIDFTSHPRCIESTDKERNAMEPMADCGASPEDGAHDSSTRLICGPEDPHSPCSLLLMPCSLLIFKDQAYSEYLHGIQDTDLHSLEKVVNASECLKQTSKSGYTSEGAAEIDGTGQRNNFHRTSTASLINMPLSVKGSQESLHILKPLVRTDIDTIITQVNEFSWMKFEEV